MPLGLFAPLKIPTSVHFNLFRHTEHFPKDHWADTRSIERISCFGDGSTIRLLHTVPYGFNRC